MSDFINTIDVLGEQTVEDLYLSGELTEFEELRLKTVRREDCLSVIPTLTKAALPLLHGSPTEQGFFSDDTLLESVSLPILANCYYGIFRGATALKQVRLPGVVKMGGNSFSGCTSLVALILPNKHVVCALGEASEFADTPIANGTGYIYVPRHLYDEYVSGTNWSAFAGQIRILQDYTVDGTIDGELDESKI